MPTKHTARGRSHVTRSRQPLPARAVLVRRERVGARCRAAHDVRHAHAVVAQRRERVERTLHQPGRDVRRARTGCRAARTRRPRRRSRRSGSGRRSTRACPGRPCRGAAGRGSPRRRPIRRRRRCSTARRSRPPRRASRNSAVVKCENSRPAKGSSAAGRELVARDLEVHRPAERYRPMQLGERHRQPLRRRRACTTCAPTRPAARRAGTAAARGRPGPASAAGANSGTRSTIANAASSATTGTRRGARCASPDPNRGRRGSRVVSAPRTRPGCREPAVGACAIHASAFVLVDVRPSRDPSVEHRAWESAYLGQIGSHGHTG